MVKRIFFLGISILPFCIGCVAGPLDHHLEEFSYQNGKLQKFTYSDSSYGEKRDSAAFVEAIDTLKQLDPASIPELEGLPIPGAKQKAEMARKYTGVIKNNTSYDLQIPSSNSDATLTVPAHGWIEFIGWKKHMKLTAYRDGHPFYCLKIYAQPRQFSYMCSQYDFIAEIAKPEPVIKQWPSKLKRRKIKRKVNPPC